MPKQNVLELSESQNLAAQEKNVPSTVVIYLKPSHAATLYTPILVKYYLGHSAVNKCLHDDLRKPGS